jgi:hypothetical protein
MEGQNKPASYQSRCKNQSLKPQSDLSIFTSEVFHVFLISFTGLLSGWLKPKSTGKPGGAWGVVVVLKSETQATGHRAWEPFLKSV